MRRASSTKSRDAAALRPGDPPVQGLFAFLAFDGEYMPKSFFEQVGAVQSGVGLGDPGQLGAWASVRSCGFFHSAYRAPLSWRARSPGPRRGASAGRPRPLRLSLRASARASFQARRRSVSSASVAQATTWNGSAHSTAAGQRSATTGGDPVGGISGDVGDLSGAFVAEGVEEPRKVALSASRGGPQRRSGSRDRPTTV